MTYFPTKNKKKTVVYFAIQTLSKTDCSVKSLEYSASMVNVVLSNPFADPSPRIRSFFVINMDP